MDFFNKLGSKITEAGQGVQEQAKIMTEQAKLNSTITSNEKTINNLYLELGKEYFELYKDEPQSFSLAYIDKINQLTIDNVELKATLNELKGVMNCEDCGAECPITNNCCSKCGALLNKTSLPNQSNPCCGGCGKVIENGVKFCTGCGAPVNQ